ncbi:hypothetical protein JEQ12_019197 [Ovis aries]|uniref:Uncharacterized protein n=1 Tax=Ovis aries TaxID=9940 RepID=A0A836CZ23_SHEEP|nr:hypothetical protein JEQ12_019197 [Ovis aries]
MTRVSAQRAPGRDPSLIEARHHPIHPHNGFRATAKLSVIMVKKIDSILSRSPFLAHQSGKILLGSDAIRVIVQKRKELRCLSEQWGLTVLFSDEPHRHRVEGQSVLRLRKFTASQQKEMSKYPEGRDCCDKGKPLSVAVNGDCSLVAVHGPLVVVAALTVDHRLKDAWTQ